MTALDPAPLEERRGSDLLLFRVGAERFAAPLAAVEEAVDLEAGVVQSIPGGSASLRGVFTLRGSLVPLYDPERALGAAPAEGTTALVARSADGGSRVAIAVDDVEDVVTVRDEEIREPSRASELDAIVRGVVQRGTTIIAVVDLHALVAACRATDGGESE